MGQAVSEPDDETVALGELAREARWIPWSLGKLAGVTAGIFEVTRAALALSHDERHELLNVLIDSMDDAPASGQADVDAAWDAEIRGRFEEARSGSVGMLSWDDVESRIDARLAAKR